MESLSKRSRLDNGGHGSNYRNTDQQDLDFFQQTNGGGDLECRRFNTPEGCPYGKSCRFRHVSTGRSLFSHEDYGFHMQCLSASGDCIGDWSSSSASAVARVEVLWLQRMRQRCKSTEYGFWRQAKTVHEILQVSHRYQSSSFTLTHQHSMTGSEKCCNCESSGCPFGESCHFLHYVPGGLSSLGLTPVVSLSASSSAICQRKPVQPIGSPRITVSGYKTKLCNRFNTPEGCRFDDRCHFAHGESDLRPSNNFSRGSNGRSVAERPSGVGPSGFGGPELSNSTSYGNANLDCQGYSELNPPGVAGDNGPSSYQSEPVGENVRVY